MVTSYNKYITPRFDDYNVNNDNIPSNGNS